MISIYLLLIILCQYPINEPRTWNPLQPDGQP